MKKTIGVVIAIIIIIVIVSLTGSSSKESGPIRIGHIAPLTGDAASYGEPARNITQMAVDEINAAGGINGRPIEMIYEDGKCKGDVAASAAQKLVNVDGVQAIIGGICSGETLAAIPVVEAKKVVLISPGASSPDLTGKSPYFFRNYPSDSSQGIAIAQSAYEKGYRKVGFVQEQTDYALGVYKSFSGKFQELGGTIIKEEVPTTVKEFRSQITKLKGENVDAIFVDMQTPALSEIFLEQLKQLAVNKPLLVNDIIMGNPGLITKYKTQLEGALGAEFGVDMNNPKFQKMAADYKAKYNVDVPYQSYAQTEYDAVYILRDAIVAVGYNGEKIAAWGRNLKGWQGATGSVTIGSDGDLVGGHRAEIIKNGKVELYIK
jgi:branched-chain amino acid transport system substrate-binding protein